MYQDVGNEPESRHAVTLDGRDARAAARLLKLIAGADVLPQTLGPDSVRGTAVDRGTGARIAKARAEYMNRRLRSEIFGRGMFGEPAWDMLLALYVPEISGGRITVVRLAELSGGPTSSAQRWIDYLSDRQLVTREPHPGDRRTTLVALSESGRNLLDLYFAGSD